MTGIKERISQALHLDTNTTSGTTGTNTTGVQHDHNTGELHKGSAAGVGTTGTSADYGTTGNTDNFGTTGTTAGSSGMTTGAATGASGMTTGAMTGQGQVIDSETFTKTEDHEVLIEKKQYELEHRPVQKQYVVETKLVGETAVAGKPTELMGTETREVEEHVKQAPHGNRTVVVENVDIPASEVRETEFTGNTTNSTF